MKLFAVAVLAPLTASAQTFNDVPADYWAYEYVETLYASGITGGCGGGNYCPENPVTRAQMAVFLERAIHGASYQPPPASGNLFLDVGANDFAAAYIEQLFNEGITGGCGGNNYCPTQAITRSQMAVFLLRAKHGSGYLPPPATGIFNDVDLSYWAVGWIEQLKAEGITTGCTAENYCPEQNVTRAQMAAFLVRAFALDEVPPAPPTNPVISNITSSSATLSWTDESDDETSFQVGFCTGLLSIGSNGVLRCVVGLVPGSGFVQIDQVGANVTSYTFTGLNAETQYSRFVRACNAAGCSANTGASFTTIAEVAARQVTIVNNILSGLNLQEVVQVKVIPRFGTFTRSDLLTDDPASCLSLPGEAIDRLQSRTFDIDVGSNYEVFIGIGTWDLDNFSCPSNRPFFKRRFFTDLDFQTWYVWNHVIVNGHEGGNWAWTITGSYLNGTLVITPDGNPGIPFQVTAGNPIP